MELTEHQKQIIEKKKQEALQRKQQRSLENMQDGLQFSGKCNASIIKPQDSYNSNVNTQSPTKSSDTQTRFIPKSPMKHTISDIDTAFVDGQCSGVNRKTANQVQAKIAGTTTTSPSTAGSTSPMARASANRLKALEKLKVKQMASPQSSKQSLFQQTAPPKKENQLNINQCMCICADVGVILLYQCLT